ncbi:MAG: AAA family ATPase, partial [Elusimicrobiota bacterium]
MTPYGRTAQESVQRALKAFRVVLITGPRQAGKTTLARLLGEGRPRRAFVSLDDLTALSSAKSDPQGFIRNLPLPVTIDEIQRAPDLLLPIKRQVDERRRPGDFLLTGSADPMAVQSVTESLAGRMAMIPLRPLTWAERLKRPGWNPLARVLKCRTAKAVAAAFPASPYGQTRLDREVLMGGFPEPALH